MKTCFKCQTEKPLAEFYKHAMMGDGHLGKCKDCTKRDVRLHRLNNDSVREYDRLRAKFPHRKKLAVAGQKRRRRENPEKRIAHQMIRRAILKGILVRKPCITCGNPKSEAHHEDHFKPLEVMWLCALHHRRHEHGHKNVLIRPF